MQCNWSALSLTFVFNPPTTTTLYHPPTTWVLLLFHTNTMLIPSFLLPSGIWSRIALISYSDFWPAFSSSELWQWKCWCFFDKLYLSSGRVPCTSAPYPPTQKTAGRWVQRTLPQLSFCHVLTFAGSDRWASTGRWSLPRASWGAGAVAASSSHGDQGGSVAWGRCHEPGWDVWSS